MNKIETNVEIVTPEKASEYLAQNKNNRRINSRHVELLMRDMKAGNWRLTHQGIAFDEYGNLLDGQHRLMACVLSKVPIETLVTRNVCREDGCAIDTQTSVRGYLDSHVFDGKERPASWRDNKSIGAVRGIVRFGYDERYTMTNAQLDHLFSVWSEQVEALYRSSSGKGISCGASVNAALLAALLHGESEEDVASFVQVFKHGDTKDSEGRNFQAPFRLASYIMKEKERIGRVNRQKIYNMTQNAFWQYVHAEKTTLLKTTGTLRYPVHEIIAEVLKEGNT